VDSPLRPLRRHVVRRSHENASGLNGDPCATDKIGSVHGENLQAGARLVACGEAHDPDDHHVAPFVPPSLARGRSPRAASLGHDWAAGGDRHGIEIYSPLLLRVALSTKSRCESRPKFSLLPLARRY
jgi:hypothetical protein